MEKTRTILELLQVMLEYAKTAKFFNGLCQITIFLIDAKKITEAEEAIIRTYLYDNVAPNFWKTNDSYWWKCGNKKPRLRWLNKHINLLK